MTSFDFPDPADFPENDAEPYPDDAPAPAFYHRRHFDGGIERLKHYAAQWWSRQLVGPEREAAARILDFQLARVQAAARAWFDLPPVHGCELSGVGVTTRSVDTEPLAAFFTKDIKAASAQIPKTKSLKEIDRVVVRRDALACAKVQGFLGSLGLMAQANKYRRTVNVASVAVHVSRPYDRHHSQQFADCETTTKLLNLHLDPKPGILKAIIYLSEVTPETGPFQCVKGSNRWDYDNIERIFAWGNSVGNYLDSPLHRTVACALPRRYRKTAIVGRLLLDGTERSDFMLKRLTSVTSDYANVMLFDPCFMFHRGGQCEKGERVNLQVVLK